MRRTAIISPCGHYRYTLERRWGPGPAATFVLLNPSTADAHRDDPTCRRGMGFARSWGFDACVFVNLFALRSTDPAALRTAADPVGPDNDRRIRQAAGRAGVLVAAWGVHGALHGRDLEVHELLGTHDLQCLGLTKDGHPRHPLYVNCSAKPSRFPAPLFV